MNGLKTNHNECKSGFTIAEFGSTQSETQQKYTCYEEENKSTLQKESELHLTTVRFFFHSIENLFNIVHVAFLFAF